MASRLTIVSLDLRSQVAAKETQQEAAAHFLNNAISPSIPNSDDDIDLNPLYRLLKAMEEHGGPAKTLAKLAEKMKKAIPYTEGMFLLTYFVGLQKKFILPVTEESV